MNKEKWIPSKIPTKELVRFITTVIGPDVECPMCKNTTWNINSVNNEHVGYSASQAIDIDNNKLDPKFYTPSITLVCKNCNYMWHLWPKGVEDWIAKNSNSESEN